MSRRLLVDTAVLAYAVGDEHPLRASCRAIVEAATIGEIELHGSVEVVQEFLFHRLRRGPRADAVSQARDVATICVLHPFDAQVAERMLQIVASTTVGGRDAVHAATALVQGFESIVSPDLAFESVPGLRRVDPGLALG